MFLVPFLVRLDALHPRGARGLKLHRSGATTLQCRGPETRGTHWQVTGSWPISAHFLFRTSGVRPRRPPPSRDTSRQPWQVSAIKLITVLRGFKIPVAVLDRFLEANRAEPTDDHPPFYHRSEPDAGSKLLFSPSQSLKVSVPGCSPTCVATTAM